MSGGSNEPVHGIMLHLMSRRQTWQASGKSRLPLRMVMPGVLMHTFPWTGPEKARPPRSITLPGALAARVCCRPESGSISLRGGRGQHTMDNTR
jgi:hypothetical protein